MRAVAVLGHLNAGHQRAIEVLEDQRVHDVGIGMELPHPASEVRIHDRLDGTFRLGLGVKQVPELTAEYSKPTTFASPPFQRMTPWSASWPPPPG